MLRYYLTTHVHVCRLDESVVFLDLRSNKYLTVPPEDIQLLCESIVGFSSLRINAPQSDTFCNHQKTIDSLIQLNMITAVEENGKPAAATSIISRRAIAPGLGRTVPNSVSAAAALHFSRSYLEAQFILRSKKLYQGLTWLARKHERTRENALPPDDRVAPIRAIEAFRRLRVLTYTAKNYCLLDALTLAIFLHRYRYGPTFIIGVRTKPFVAHAWVQIDDCIVDDRHEAIAGFTPILAI